jgi:hypothetical protein
MGILSNISLMSMKRSSIYGSLVKASLGRWKPNTVDCIEWVLEMQCEVVVACVGGLPLKGQGIESKLYLAKIVLLSGIMKFKHFILSWLKCFFL